MFWGQNDYLVETYALNTALQLANGEDITKVYFDDYNFDYCYDTLTQSSLFSSTNILLIKLTKKLQKKDIDKLIEACSINSDSKVIFSCIGETDFKTMTKSFNKKSNSVDVRFFIPTDGEAIAILSQESQKLNIQVDHQALAFLYNMHQKNLSLSVSDLSKLSILSEPITAKTINHHCFGLGSVNIEDFLIDLFSGNPINKSLYLLLEEGINEIQLLARITSFAQILFMINSYLKLHGNLNIKEIWGYLLPVKIAQQQASVALKYKFDDYKYMMNFLQELELELKSGKVADINAYFQAKLRVFIK
jgi:DNA polymerase-3 subunit delta